MSPSRTIAHMRADEVLRAIANVHTQDFFMTEVKDGPTISRDHMRLDAVAIPRSYSHPRFIGYEVKVSRSDWLRDDKWHAYTDFCHEFYIACPSGLIQHEEVPEGVGLAWVTPGSLHVTRKRKALYRKIEPDAMFLLYVVYSRLESDRWPFFSDAEAYFRALVEHKRNAHMLGQKVKGAIRERIQALQDEAEQARDQLAEFENLKAVFKEFGVNIGRYGAQYEARQILKEWRNGGGMPPDLRDLRFRLADAERTIRHVIDKLTAKSEKAEEEVAP